MLPIFAGLRSQITLLKEKLKKHNPTKNPKVYKEILDALEAAEKRYSAERTKRVEKQKAKEQKAQEVDKEAAPKVEDDTVVMPKKEFVEEHEKLVKELEPMVEEHKEQGAELKEVKEASPKCAICAIDFKSYPEYQKHQEEAHGHREYTPMDPGIKKDIVKRVEDKTPAIISEQEKPAAINKKIKFDLDQKVKPVRGEGSVGRVMRHDSPEDLAYVMWEEGSLKDRDGFGGYYSDELSAVEEPKIEEPKQEVKAEVDIYADLKDKYNDLLKDLKEERATHYESGNYKWVERLDGKIKEVEEKLTEKFGAEITASGQVVLKQNGEVKKTFDSHNEALMWLHRNVDYSWDYAQKHMGWTIEEGATKEAGAQNDQQNLTVMDHTPPRANKTMDEGGKDGVDEFQDLWAGPAGTEVESAKGIPGSLFNAETAASVVERLKTELQAPFVHVYPSSLGGPENISILLAISLDPREAWPNQIFENSRSAKFHLSNDGTIEQISGSDMKLRKRTVKSIDQLISALNSYFASANQPKQASLK